MYPMGYGAPKFFGLPKIHKQDTPLRLIVSGCASVTYGVAKELPKILKPLLSKSPHHINNTQNFVEQLKSVAFHLSPSRSSPRYYQGSTGKRPRSQGKNSNVSRGQISFIRMLPQKYLLFLPGPVL